MSTERIVKVFKNGRNRAVRIPREFEFRGNEAIMRKEGKRLVIEPRPARSLLAVLSRLKPLTAKLPPIKDRPPAPVEI
jgi:antitoxin VapB